MAKPESEYPTIQDARDVLQELVAKGFGKLPVQVVIVPASTLAVLAKDAGHTGPKPAAMIEIFAQNSAEIGVLITSVKTLSTGGVH